MSKETEELLHVQDAIRAAVWDFERLRDATTLSEQASAFVALSNSMHDLSTWHPDFNVQTGEIEDYEPPV